MSQRKVLALIESDPVLKEVCRAIDSKKKYLMERGKFLESQLKKEIERYESQVEGDWALMTDRLKAMGVLEKYNENEMHLAFSFESGAIELVPNKPDFSSMFNGPFKGFS